MMLSLWIFLWHEKIEGPPYRAGHPFCCTSRSAVYLHKMSICHVAKNQYFFGLLQNCSNLVCFFLQDDWHQKMQEIFSSARIDDELMCDAMRKSIQEYGLSAERMLCCRYCWWWS